RVDLEDRGVAWSDYLAENRSAVDHIANRLFPTEEPEPAPLVTLVDHDPDAETKLVAAILYAHTNRSEREIERRVESLSIDERVAIIRSYVGERGNRRHRPGRAFERCDYRFDI